MNAHEQILEWGNHIVYEVDPDDGEAIDRATREIINGCANYYIAWENADWGTPMRHLCPLHHEWYAFMYYELGGWFYCHEDGLTNVCPRCGREAV